MNGDDAASIARIEQKIDSFIVHAKERYVSRATFVEAIAKLDGRLKPLEKLERLLWGIITVVLTGIVVALLALIITT